MNINNFQELIKKFENNRPFNVSPSDHMRNLTLQMSAKTRFKVGQLVLTKSGQIVRISEVQPSGFVSWSESKSFLTGKMLPPVTCDKDIYRYRSDDNKASGQTTESELTEYTAVTVKA